MKGQLWEECYCGTEPVCCDCGNCENHCDCAQAANDKKEIEEFETQYPGFLNRLNRHHEDGANEQ